MKRRHRTTLKQRKLSTIGQINDDKLAVKLGNARASLETPSRVQMLLKCDMEFGELEEGR